MKEKYPEITVIGTVGPFYEGTDYEAGWKFATRLNVPMVDEHYYNTPDGLLIIRIITTVMTALSLKCI